MERVELVSNINYAQVVGKIIEEVTPSHLFGGEMYYFVKVECHNGKKVNNIQMFLPESLLVQNNKMVGINDTVEVEGHLVYTKVNGKQNISVSIDKIQIVDESTEHKNSIHLEGAIVRTYELRSAVKNDSKSIKSIIIKHESSKEDEGYFTARVITWNSLAKKVDKDYKVGDVIVIKGELKSFTKKVDNKCIDYHEILAKVVLNKKSE